MLTKLSVFLVCGTAACAGSAGGRDHVIFYRGINFLVRRTGLSWTVVTVSWTSTSTFVRRNSVLDHPNSHQMHYIRFLKTPSLTVNQSRSSVVIEALITITSDLGDELFPGHVVITSSVVAEAHGHGQEKPMEQRTSAWKPGMRVMPLKHQVQLDDRKISMRLHVSHQDGQDFDQCCRVSIDDMPLVVPAWCGPFSIEKQSSDRIVERRLQLPGGEHVRIQEEAAESIARHIW